MRAFLVSCVLVAAACESSSAPPPPRLVVDINSATRAELEALPAIGEAYAAKIVAGRPYDNKRQLVSRGILPESVYDKVHDMVIAKQR